MIRKKEMITDPLWYKDAVIYELPVKSFYDSNGDGMGDFRGLIEKLDYLHDLGVTAVWLLPFYPSPLLDDGYDIADYFRINTDYGTLGDFKLLLREAHRRDIRVITELVINHTSDQHPWFQRARRAKPGSPWRDFYVWSDTPDKYQEVRIIFTDFENSNWTWDSVAQAYYWHRFYKHQPDLNYDNPRVQKEVFRALDYWLDMGVDGLRLDAIPYLFEREGTNCENLPETHAFLKELRTHVNGRYPDKMLLAEANQWPEDASRYFGDGDECHMAFHFPVMPRLFMALRMEDRFPIIDILEQSLDIPESCQWAMFLRNHDELTLEMVTDEERDYMYKAYAQDPRSRVNVGIRRRLAPLLDNNRRKMELMNSLLLSLPGTPIIYYGDELGMGDNYYLGDRDGVRTPMQWSPDRNAGFSKAGPHKLYLPVIIDSEYHFATVNVENQSRNLSSLLWFMRRMIAVRKRFRAFGRGSFEFIPSDNPKVLSYMRTWQDERILVVANLSRYCHVVNLDMREYSHFTLEEVFSGNRFPDVTERPYSLTLAPHTFFWFSLTETQPAHIETENGSAVPEFTASWDRLFVGGADEKIVQAVKSYIRHCRWFGGKARPIRRISVGDILPFGAGESKVYLLFLDVIYTNAPRETYFLPLAFIPEEHAAVLRSEYPQSIIATVVIKNERGFLYEAVADTAFQQALLELAVRRSTGGKKTGIVCRRGRDFKRLRGDETRPLDSRLLKAEQSNSSILYDKTFFLKLYRRLDEGINPDIELSRHLTEHTRFKNLPAYAASFEWQRPGREPVSLGILLEYVAAENDAWAYSLDAAERCFQQVLLDRDKLVTLPDRPDSLFEVAPEVVPECLSDYIGSLYLQNISLLGTRIAEMHRALASLRMDASVTPESYSLLYQKSIYQSMRSLTQKVFTDLSESRAELAADLKKPVGDLLGRRSDILALLRRITERKISARKIRTHGDLHLGQVLYTGRDFVVIDFEGEPARTLSERRLKRSALRDVAGMIRSFHYAAYGTIFLRLLRQGMDIEFLYPWADLWYTWVAGTFLQSYRAAVQDSGIVPADEKDFRLLLDVFLVEKAVYELGYEINNRPDWLIIPVRGLQGLLDAL